MNTILSSYHQLLLVHAGCTLFLVGLIWVIQLVHYPLFAYVGAEDYERYQQIHMQRITWIVAPVMLAEVACALALISWPQAPNVYLTWLGLGLLTIIWLSTVFLQVPSHATLTQGWNAEAHSRLVTSNWVRTVAWTARGLLSLWLLR